MIKISYKKSKIASLKQWFFSSIIFHFPIFLIYIIQLSLIFYQGYTVLCNKPQSMHKLLPGGIACEILYDFICYILFVV